MSYDVFVFDVNDAPQNQEEFIAWWEGTINSDALANYHLSEEVSESLRSFYEILKEKFPPMNGPDASSFGGLASATPQKKVSFWKRLLGQGVRNESTDEDLSVTDYEFFRSSIHLIFSWSVAPVAHQEVVKAAMAAGVGFFDACGDEGIYRTKNQLAQLIEQ